MALLAGTCRAMPSSARGLKSGGFTGYAHAGGSSAPSAEVEEKDATASARIETNVFMLSSPCNGSNRLVQPRLPEWTKELDLRTAVHDDLQARSLRQPRRLVVAHAELRPQHLGADRDRLARDLGQCIGVAKHLDHVHGPLDRG